MTNHQPHIFLVGYRGSGKSTVGRLLAERLNIGFLDTDDAIETEAGISIAKIFEQEGESGFRDREERAVHNAAGASEPWVISLGGGAILRKSNRLEIRESGKCVWLQGSPEALFARISADSITVDRRPKLSARGGYSEVVEMLELREPIYLDLADFTVATDHASPDEIVTKITDWLNSDDCFAS